MPDAMQEARNWEEEAAFGVDDQQHHHGMLQLEGQNGLKRMGAAIEENGSGSSQALNHRGRGRHTGNHRPLAGEQYRDIIQARREGRGKRRQDFDRWRQDERKQIRRPVAAKRLAGGIFYDPDAAKKEFEQSASMKGGVLTGLLNMFGIGPNPRGNNNNLDEAGNSVFDSEDLPRENFREHYESLIRGWERDGMFWDYRLPATPDPESTLPDPQPRSSKIVVVVLSTRHQMELRKVIRETWGKDHVVYFVIGGKPTRKRKKAMDENDGENAIGTAEKDEEIQQQLQSEAGEFQDILDSIHPESYRSLPYKLKFAYEWVIRNVPEAKWILKVDDDMFARIGTLDEALLRKLNPEEPFVLGKIVPDALVSRTGKWAEYLYNKRFYPYWPKGSHGHVVSRPVAEYVANIPNITYYQGEDTSLGIWLSESDLRVTWICSPYFQNHGRCEEDEWIVIGHQISAGHMRECSDKLDEWNQEDFEDQQRNFWFTETRAQKRWSTGVEERKHQKEMFPI